MTIVTNLRGIVRGRTIELDSDLSLPEGQAVRLTVSYEPAFAAHKSLDQLAGCGGWSDMTDEEFEEFNDWVRRSRRDYRAMPGVVPNDSEDDTSW